eukprot:tig00020693_g13047.t1
MTGAEAFEPPRCRPLASLAELEAWRGGDPWNQLPAGGAPLRGASPPRPQRVQRVLHCHDMCGGYVQDADAQTRWGLPDPYVFRSWSLVDAFCYFSHHRVTLPPRGWTEAAHRHGVSVLGTFITEWKEGEAENLRLLEGPPGGPAPPAGEPSYYYAERLVDVAQYYGFDGWLLNFESPVPSPRHAALLVKWVAYLTKLMHERVPGSTVMWYDALDFSGRIRWQNEVNHNNIEFMRASDSIFTNYTWKEAAPARSAQLVGPDRRRDVFFGIDCFGRNTYGGGGFDAWKALEVIAKAGLSAAIFAPGWTWENRPEGEKTRAAFDSREDRFWTGVGAADPAEGVAGYVEPRGLPSSLPFATTFCRGAGGAFFLRGAPARAGPWLDFGLQALQPSFPLGPPAAGPAAASLSASFAYGAAYDGGGSLLFSGRLERPGDHGVFRLLRVALEVPASGVRVTLAFRPADGVQEHAFALAMALDDGTVLRMPCPEGSAASASASAGSATATAVATSSRTTTTTTTTTSSSSTVVSSSVTSSSPSSVSTSSSSSSFSAYASASTVTLSAAAALGSACEGGWQTRSFDVPPAFSGRIVREVLLVAGGAGAAAASASPVAYGVHLGFLSVVPAEAAASAGPGPRAGPAALRAEEVAHDPAAGLAATLAWEAVPGTLHYDIFRRPAVAGPGGAAGEWAFEGRARGPARVADGAARVCFRAAVRGEGVPPQEFAVQAVSYSGARGPLARCPTVRVPAAAAGAP